jgi:hypothetical protein
MARGSARVLSGMASTAGDKFGQIARMGREQAAKLAGAIQSTMGSVDRVVNTGLGYVCRATNEALKSFGAHAPSQSLTARRSVGLLRRSP